jgi:alpha/beta hydrolase family protein
LLFDVAAILTSVALGPAAEAFAAPQNVVIAASTPWVDAADALSAGGDSGAPFIGPTPYLGPDLGPQPYLGPDLTITSLSGIQLLQQFAVLTPSQIDAFVDARPDAIADLLANPPVARDVTVWWGKLTPAVQTSLRTASPELIGNLEGLPFEVRDGANREFLEQTIDHLRDVIASDAGRTIIDHAEQQLHMLDAIAESLESDGGPERTLLSLDVTGQGRAAIAIGNLRTADYVSYLVPGMFFTIENQMGDWSNAAAELYAEQVDWLKIFAAKDGAKAGAAPAPTSTVATIAWIGYHTPNLTNVGALDNAIEGRDSLAGAVEGLQAVRAQDEPFVTVVAHSYGSTAALMALAEDSFEIDALAMVGSPGSDAQSVDALHVRNGNVWVGEAAWDPVPNSSFFGSDPGSPAYGAHRMGVDGGTDVITQRQLGGSIGHNEYFGAGSQSMRNLALIAIDRADFVSDGSSADAAKTLDLLR